MEEKIDKLLKDSKDAVYHLKRKMNTTKRIAELNDVIKNIEINQENIIYLAEMLKDTKKVQEKIPAQKLDKVFKRIEKNIERSYQF